MLVRTSRSYGLDSSRDLGFSVSYIHSFITCVILLYILNAFHHQTRLTDGWVSPTDRSVYGSLYDLLHRLLNGSLSPFLLSITPLRGPTIAQAEVSLPLLIGKLAGGLVVVQVLPHPNTLDCSHWCLPLRLVAAIGRCSCRCR
jgi:hypothetical protein